MPETIPRNIESKALTEPAVVHVVEDDVDLRDALSCLMTSVGLPHHTYDTPAAFLDALTPANGGCLLFDLRLPGMSGIELAKEVRRRGIASPILMMSAHADVPVTIQAFKLGALDFLIKPFQPQQVLAAVQDALSKDQVRRRHENQTSQLQARLQQLTPKDWDVIELLRAGHPNKRIAAMLGISERAVEMRRSKILKKTQTSGLPGLMELIAIRPS